MEEMVKLIAKAIVDDKINDLKLVDPTRVDNLEKTVGEQKSQIDEQQQQISTLKSTQDTLQTTVNTLKITN